MLTHQGRLDDIQKDVGDITVDWLERHGVKYNELQFGKLYFDVLIDDKAITPEVALTAMKSF